MPTVHKSSASGGTTVYVPDFDADGAAAAAVAALVAGAPAALDTLDELAAAINDDASLYTTLVAAIAAKVAQSITDGVTASAPSQDVVFDALALKASITYADGKVTQAITNGTTASAPSEDKVFDALALKMDASAGLSADLLPWLIDINPKQGAIAVVGTWANAIDALSGSGGYTRNQSNTQNDEINFDVVLAAGTWTIELIAPVNSDQAIITAKLGATTVGTMDQYAASLAYGSIKSITSITVSTTAKYRLKLLAATKNAGSSGYLIRLDHIQLRRTA